MRDCNKVSATPHWRRENWVIVAFDTAGEVVFTEANTPTSQVFKRLPDVHRAYSQTSPAVSLLVRTTWKPYIPQAVSCDASHRARHRRDIYDDRGLSKHESHLSVQNNPSVGAVFWHTCVGVVDSNHTLSVKEAIGVGHFKAANLAAFSFRHSGGERNDPDIF
jgi:hypothetical protein